jgi:hypothetical protein
MIAPPGTPFTPRDNAAARQWPGRPGHSLPPRSHPGRRHTTPAGFLFPPAFAEGKAGFAHPANNSVRRGVREKRFYHYTQQIAKNAAVPQNYCLI